MRKILALAFFLPGCAALIDPANHGTAYMRAAWAQAAPGEAMCEQLYPNDKMIRVARSGDQCLCATTPLNMGASYYADDHAPMAHEQAQKVHLQSLEEATASIIASAKTIAETPCPAKRKVK